MFAKQVQTHRLHALRHIGAGQCIGILGIALGLTGLTACAPLQTASVSPAITSAPSASATLALLATIPVKGRAPGTGYSSSGDFWGFWATPTGVATKCDTRNWILARDMSGITYKNVSPKGCVVQTGALVDPYTGTTIDFVRASCPDHDGCVQIDHVVARMDAWETGADTWTAAQRKTFANDPLELLAVSSTANQQKGDGDAATWLPDKSFRCEYVSIQTQVKAKYGLWMTQAEHNTIQQILRGC